VSSFNVQRQLQNNVVDLYTHFLQHKLFKTLIDHYWLLEEYDESFHAHLNVLKVFFCNPKKARVAKYVVTKVLCAFTLDVQKSIFKITMKSNA
jgi:hypothetical protein